ncbi:MAG: 5-formyltetrahydrofolate cyclo-ligase [Actinomycetota bacterium]
MDKTAWRARARRERSGRAIDHTAHAEVIVGFLTDIVPPDRWIVVFDPLPDEVDLGPLVAAHPDPSQRYAVTRTPEVGHHLTVHPWGGPTERHRYGFDQPTAEAPVVPDEALGAVLVPGLAFDRAGRRLGRGKGYYDRFLARLAPDVLRIGITGDYVVDGPLPTDAHDVSMTHLATTHGILPVGEAG